MSQTRRDLEKAAQRAIWQEAIFRTRSALTIAGTLVLTAFTALVAPGSLFWLPVLIVGLLLEVGVIFSTLRDPAVNAKAVATIFEREFKTRSLHSRELRKKADEALEYLGQIEATVGQTKEGVLRDRLARTTQEVIDWVEAIHRLAGKVDAFQTNNLIHRDMKEIPEDILRLRGRLLDEDDASVLRQIEQTILDKERQLASLTGLNNTIENAELQLERTLTALGTVYSQLLLLDTKGDSADRAERLQEEISDQIHRLQDLSLAMDEVYMND